MVKHVKANINMGTTPVGYGTTPISYGTTRVSYVTTPVGYGTTLLGEASLSSVYIVTSLVKHEARKLSPRAARASFLFARAMLTNWSLSCM